jgi:hypothetical protein
VTARNKEARAEKQKPPTAVEDGETQERQEARAKLHPAWNNSITILKVMGEDIGAPGLVELLADLGTQCLAVSSGDLRRPEAVLTAQMQTLDAIFNHLTRFAYRNWRRLDHAEPLLRLALKAQSQCRATVEAIGVMKNPPPTVIAKQANVTSGPQQVNNGLGGNEATSAHGRKIQNRPNKLMEHIDGQRLDPGAAGQAVGSDPAMASVGAFDRPQNKGG